MTTQTDDLLQTRIQDHASSRELLSKVLLSGTLLLIVSWFGDRIQTHAKTLTAAGSDFRVHINRAGKRLYLINEKSEIVLECPIGIGCGGLARKTSMSDEITPTGDFIVDIILCADPEKTAVSSRYQKQYQSRKQFFKEIESHQALANMFKHMNAMDFNHDGQADNAYGSAYFGLSSNNAITGPKLRRHAGTIYWYSIALHGTSMTDNIGKSNSGGCIHVPKEFLSRLLVDKLMKINSRVTIRDQPPQLTADQSGRPRTR